MKKIILFSIITIFLFYNCQQTVSPKNKTLGIQVFGKFNTTLLDTLQNTIENAYGFNVIILNKKPLPKSAFINVKSPRYRADSILQILKRTRPDTIDYMLALTEKDISWTKRDKSGGIKKPENKYKDWGIFGLGNRPGPCAVVSTFRLKKSTSHSKFIDRTKKVCTHELGHNLGLKHCTYDENCVMRDAAETIKTVDYIGFDLCENCKRLIQIQGSKFK